MPTTIKEALAKWEEKTGEKAAAATRVDLYGMVPPIEKMEPALNTLVKCERLSLSTNCIDKISNLQALKSLKILSLGRNYIKTLAGIEVTAETLNELYISYNFIEKMKGINALKKLKVLYMSYNLVKDWAEFVKLNEISSLVELVFVGNPLQEKHAADGDWVQTVANKNKTIRKLDGNPILRDED